MAEEELQAKLRELDHELEDGDITKKGCAAAREGPLRWQMTDTRQVREAPDAPAIAVLWTRRAGRLVLGRPVAYCLPSKHLCRTLRRRGQLQQCPDRRRTHRFGFPRPLHACQHVRFRLCLQSRPSVQPPTPPSATPAAITRCSKSP